MKLELFDLYVFFSNFKWGLIAFFPLYMFFFNRFFLIFVDYSKLQKSKSAQKQK